MKKIILAVFTIIVMVCTFSFVASALANDNPGFSPAKGYVCTKQTSTTKNDNRSGSDTYTANYTYDSKGRLIKIATVFKDSGGHNFIITTTQTYDSKGNVIKFVTTSKSDDGFTVTNTETCAYDSKGDIIKESETAKSGNSVFHEETTYITTTRTYDSNGNCLKETKKFKDDEGHLVGTYTISYTYDSKGRLTKEVMTVDEYTSVHLLNIGRFFTGTVTTTYSYDSEGKKIKASDTIKGTLCEDSTKFTDSATKTYTYDSKGNCTKSVYTYIQNGSVFSTETTNFTYKKLTDVIKVKGLKVSDVSTGSISLSWTKFDGAKYYKVQKYDAANKKWVTVSTVSSNSVKVQELAAGKTYKFRVTALDKNKKAISEASAALTVSTLCKAPKTTLTSSSSKTATVTITKVTGATEYKIYKSTDGKNFKLTKTTKNLKTKLTGLSGGKKVYIKVKAVNADGKPSAYSSVKSVTVKK